MDLELHEEEYNLLKKSIHVKNKIVFLDRDGTINELKTDYVKKLSEFIILPNVSKYLSKLTSAGFKLIIITNQSAVGRGLISLDELDKIHKFLTKKFFDEKCIINKIFFCPHVPNDLCPCRKPKTLLFEKALDELSPVDIENCWMIGDSESDILPAKKLQIKSILIKNNQSLEESVNKILDSMSK